MPETSTGTSIAGLQKLGNFNSTINPFQIRFASAQNLSRVAPLGNALICLAISNGRLPVILAVPVYGGGIAPNLVTAYPGNTLEMWVSWYRAGYQWFFERPSAV